MRAFFALGKLRLSGSFFPWLLGIAARVVKEQWRAEHRYRVALGSMPPRAEPVAVERDHALEHAMAELPARYAEVVLLRYYGGRTCKEAASELGMPLGTITKALSRAYAMLREKLSSDMTQDCEVQI